MKQAGYIAAPQIVWARAENTYEYMLYNVVQMVIDELGECRIPTGALAKMCKMSVGTVSRTRKSLLEKGLLKGSIVSNGPYPTWQLEIPDLLDETIKWRKDHPDVQSWIDAKPVRGLRGTILERDNYVCKCCGAQTRLHLDHIVPRSKGGPTEEGNLQVLCSVCNIRKGTKTIRY